MNRREFLSQVTTSISGLVLASNFGVLDGEVDKGSLDESSQLHASGGRVDSSGYEYIAGQVTLPFSYSVKTSSAPRPPSLDFSKEPNPDNSQALVRIDGELWQFRNHWITGQSRPSRYKGPDIDHMTQLEDGSYPDGMTMCWFLGGMWYDKSEGKLYAPMHVEQTGVHRHNPVACWAARKISLATSVDKGKTWQFEGDIITGETYYYTHDAYMFSGSCYANGVGDFGFYTDWRDGYFYIFPEQGWYKKGKNGALWGVRAARCAIKDRMAPGNWRYFYKGKWDQPARGGKSSIIAPSHFWGIIYSTYLGKYICVQNSNQDPVTPQNTDGVCIGVCSDLSKQDWVWGLCPKLMFGFMNVLNAEGNDLTTCNRTFRHYAYFSHNSFQRADITLAKGQTTAFTVTPRYCFESHPESSDPVLGRKTRIVGCRDSRMMYSGTWTIRNDPHSFEDTIKESAGDGSSFEFSFKGSNVYWRAVRSPASGKAEIYLDGVLRGIADCYSPHSTTCNEFAYIKIGLDASREHTIKIVVLGKKDSASKRKPIGHIAIEYSAESYRASAGFCSLMGKSNWYYLEKTGRSCREMQFIPNESAFENYWFGDGKCRIGNNYQTPDKHHEAIRKWVAPHGGVVEVEGRAALNQTSSDDISAAILLNATEVWHPDSLAGEKTRSHALVLSVNQGDSISFVVKQKSSPQQKPGVEDHKVVWDPVITYVKSTPATWIPNLPGKQNLALNHYATSKELDCDYRPFDAVDGNASTAFIIKADDKISSGDDWLRLDLGKKYRMDRYVVISNSQDSKLRLRNFSLQKSDDGFVWTTVDSGAANTSTRVERAVPQFNARYVRLYLPEGKPFAINEFQLYYTGGKALK